MRLVRTVDVDVAFLAEFLVDWVWLWVAGQMAGVHPARSRLTAVSALAAAAGVLSRFPLGAFLDTGPARLLGSAAWVVLAYAGVAPVSAWLRIGLGYLMVGMAMAGGSLMLAPHGTGGSVVAAPDGVWQAYAQRPAPHPLTAVGMALAIGGGAVMVRAARAWQRWRQHTCTVDIDVDGRSVALTALIDTGNTLTEAVTGLPVVVADASALAGLLPAAVLAVARRWCLADRLPPGSHLPDLPLADHLPDLPPPWCDLCRAVPYRALGTPSGVLLAFGPAALRIRGPGDRDGKAPPEQQAFVGLSPMALDGGGAFQALMPAALLPEGATGGDAA